MTEKVRETTTDNAIAAENVHAVFCNMINCRAVSPTVIKLIFGEQAHLNDQWLVNFRSAIVMPIEDAMALRDMLNQVLPKEFIKQ